MKINDEQKRNVEIKIRLTKQEHDCLMEIKTKSRLAEWVRETCLQVSDNPRKKHAPRELLASLSRIGNNINQIARYLNTRKDISPMNVIEALANLHSIEKRLQSIEEHYIK